MDSFSLRTSNFQIIWMDKNFDSLNIWIGKPYSFTLNYKSLIFMFINFEFRLHIIKRFTKLLPQLEAPQYKLQFLYVVIEDQFSLSIVLLPMP